MTTPSTARFVVFAFVAGFLATLVFNQSAGFVLNKVGLAPPGFTAWALDPLPPWGVPTIVSKAFWGGLGRPAAGLFCALRAGEPTGRAGYCLAQCCPRLLVSSSYPRSKGCPYPTLRGALPFGASVNGAWGFGTALILRLTGAARRQ